MTANVQSRKRNKWLGSFGMKYTYFGAIVIAVIAIIVGRFTDVKADDWTKKLEDGYKNNSAEPLSEFLSDWHSKSKPLTENHLRRKPVFEQEVYSIYRVIFNPSKLVGPDNNPYLDDAPFILVQDSVHVLIVDSKLSANIQKDRNGRIKTDRLPVISSFVVESFCPPVDSADKKVIYLQDRFKAEVADFVLQDRLPLGVLAYEWSNTGERRARLAYLQKSVPILEGHWGRGWVFATYPIVSRVYLSSDFNRAIVNYDVPYYRLAQGLLEKGADNQWKLVSQVVYAME